MGALLNFWAIVSVPDNIPIVFMLVLVGYFTYLSFDEARADRTPGLLGGLEVPFLGRETLIRNQRALGRARDRTDLESLEPGT